MVNAASFPNLAGIAITAVVVIGLVIYVLKQRTIPGAWPLLALLLLRGVWLFFRTFELLSVDIDAKLDWFVLSSALNPLFFAASFSIIYEYAGHRKWLDRRNTLTLIAPSILLSLLIMTQDPDHFTWIKIWGGSIYDTLDSLLVQTFFVYYLFYFITSAFLLIRLSLRWPIYRWSSTLILVGLYTSGIIELLKFLGLIRLYPMDFSVLASGFILFFYVFGVLWLRSFEMMSQARNTALENMQDGILAIDLQNQITFQNPAAQKILSSLWLKFNGRTSEPSKKTLEDVVDLAIKANSHPVEIMVEDAEAVEYYAMYSMPLTDPNRRTFGRLIVFQNITEVERAQKAILSEQNALATVQERARVARELHDDLGQVLGYVKMQSQAANELLAKGDYSSAKVALERLTSVAQNAHTDIRKYIYSNSPIPQVAEQTFLPALQQFLEHYGRLYDLCVTLVIPEELYALHLDQSIHFELLRILQEALNNAKKHSHASCVSVSFARLDDHLQVIVQDDGQGFNPDNLSKIPGTSFGLLSMLQRAEKIGGSIEIQSAPNEGTKVIVQVPLQQPISFPSETMQEVFR